MHTAGLTRVHRRRCRRQGLVKADCKLQEGESYRRWQQDPANFQLGSHYPIRHAVPHSTASSPPPASRLPPTGAPMGYLFSMKAQCKAERSASGAQRKRGAVQPSGADPPQRAA